ncbi:hypothetical protein AcV7_005942 [Taiwanofungus camphoratus]|nr:hypothetical protein AcV7_005942 [Antrodia cinnamomea]
MASMVMRFVFSLAVVDFFFSQVHAFPHFGGRSAGQAYTSGNITVGNNGTQLAYIDTGAPGGLYSLSYTTIFAVHGEAYYSPVFANVMSLAPVFGLRFVALNRRDYPQSTPYSSAELTVLSNGTDAEKTTFLQDRGIEIATFIDTFIQQENLPAVSSDGKSGGVAVLGWSLGNSFTIATIANVDTLPAAVQQRLGSYIRALIMQEPPEVALGTYFPPQSWSPQLETSIPTADQNPAFVQWITSYFQHGDLSTRNPDVLQYVLPATFRAPTVFNMTPDQLAGMTYLPPSSGSDAYIMVNLGTVLLASYKKACYNSTIRQLLPKMNIWEFTGDVTASFAIPAYWSIQDDNTAAGGGFVNFRMIDGVNHFMHWDDPFTAIQAYLESLS